MRAENSSGGEGPRNHAIDEPTHSSEVTNGVDTKNGRRGREPTIDRPLPPFLYQLYSAPPARRTAAPRRYLSWDEKRYIAYRITEGESCAVIGSDMGIPEATVRSFSRRIKNDAGLLLDCGFSVLVEAHQSPSTSFWLCRYCGDTRATSMGAGSHAIEHVR